MPHKRNPILSERLCGLARVLRGYLWAGLEDVALWHERDISHSSVERVVLPDASLLTLLHAAKATGLIAGLVVHPERALANLTEGTYGLVFSQSVLLALVAAGLSRDDAYRIVQRDARAAWDRAAALPPGARRRPRGHPRRRRSSTRPSTWRVRCATSTGSLDALEELASRRERPERPPLTLPLLQSGKVRELYDAGDGRLLMVASDRIAAFDVIMAEPIPDKGRVLTAMTAYWFEELADVAPDHLVSADPPSFRRRRPRRPGDLARGRRPGHAGAPGRDAAHRVHRPRLPGRLRPTRSTQRSGTVHGRPCPPACDWPTACPSPSSPRPPRPPRATT